MTVGIAFTNGLEAIAITDSRESGWGRQTDSVNKMGDFRYDKYYGVVFGTGSANLIEGVIRNLIGLSAESLDSFVEAVQKNYKSGLDSYDNRFLASEFIEIEKKANLIVDEGERKQFTKNELSRLMQNYDDSKKNTNRWAYFVLVGYDKDQGKVRLFSFDLFTSREVCTAHIEIGSGADGANLYLGTKLQGVDSTKLRLADLAFFSLNAYSTSTVNQGVGGTPKIARISEKGCEIVPVEKTVVLANLSGAYLSEFPASVLNHESTRTRFGEILDGSNPRYDIMAQELGLSQDTLRTVYIPASSWQERANRRLFNPSKIPQRNI